MKRSHPFNTPECRLPDHICQLSQELQGALEIGMQKEALRLARELLKWRPVHPLVFYEALSAILIQSDPLHQWRPAVEKAFETLTNRFQRLLRSEMLGFYASLRDWKQAALFLPARPKEARELMFAMWTLLELRKIRKRRSFSGDASNC